MGSQIIVTGSLAFDYIMDFPDAFRKHILPKQLHILNVGFLIPEMHQDFGGTAGNIAYTAALLGGDPRIVSVIGSDGDGYLTHLQRAGVSTELIRRFPRVRTASAYIITDRDDNQIAAFHPGASVFAKTCSIARVVPRAVLAIIAPNDIAAMRSFVDDCVARNLPFVFDPGQALAGFSVGVLRACVTRAAFLIVNDYELRLLLQKTGWTEKALLRIVPVVITTLGAKGSVIQACNERIVVPPVSTKKVLDPTGAGDAYRAGFFTAFVRGLDFEICGRVGSVAATYAVETLGTQRHRFTRSQFAARYERTYRQACPLPI